MVYDHAEGSYCGFNCSMLIYTVLLWSITLYTPTTRLHCWYIFFLRLITMCCVAFFDVMYCARSEVFL